MVYQQQTTMHALLLVLMLRIAQAYLSEWALLNGRPTQPTCVDIHPNMSLCHGIGYKKMRLPNLLDHDSMAEVSQQAKVWIPLLGLKCNEDTQLFLCSLFAPVCLDRPIYPCRSLCEKVRSGCEGRMVLYGFPWPEMLRCEKFAADNDMCIASQSTEPTQPSLPNKISLCKACSQESTYENILDNFCRAEFAIKAKIRPPRPDGPVRGKILKIYKQRNVKSKEVLRFTVENFPYCECSFIKKIEKKPFLIMGKKGVKGIVASFLTPWERHDEEFQKAAKKFKDLLVNCTDPKMVSETMLKDQSGKEGHSRKKDRRKNNKQLNV